MTGRWREWAEQVLADVDASLPADADLQTRHQACLRAKPYEFHVTSWGQKVWAPAQRAYLERYGLPPLVRTPPMSPTERAAAKAKPSPKPAAYMIRAHK